MDIDKIMETFFLECAEQLGDVVEVGQVAGAPVQAQAQGLGVLVAQGFARVAVVLPAAARLGRTRLIDNLEVNAGPTVQ